MNWGNAFGLGHQLNYQLTTSADLDRSIGHSASYVVPLPWHHLLTFSGAWSRINADVPVDFDSQGTSWQTGCSTKRRCKRPSAAETSPCSRVPTSSAPTATWSSAACQSSITDIVQAVLGYRMSSEDKYGRTGISATVVYSAGSIGSRNETRYFDISCWGAESDYSYARIDLESPDATTRRLRLALERIVASRKRQSARLRTARAHGHLRRQEDKARTTASPMAAT